jgi:hypothetical protein
MRDFHFEEPNTVEIELSQEELAELDRRRVAARNGPWYTMEEVRDIVNRKITEWKSQGPRK